MMLIQGVLVAAWLLRLTSAAVAAAPWTVALPRNYPLPGNLSIPQTYPRPSLPYNETTPTHFALSGYSYDQTIVNAAYYANASIPNITAGQLLPAPIANTSESYGSYAFSIGPQRHIFASNDGRPGFLSTALRPNSSIEITYFFFDSWKHYWGVNRLINASDSSSIELKDPIPTCEIVPVWNLLSCDINGTALEFGYCGDSVEYSPKGWGKDTVVWGTNVEKVEGCKKIALHATQVSKEYGDSVASVHCNKFPETVGC